jgi:iron-sulfur cluster insertion protein
MNGTVQEKDLLNFTDIASAQVKDLLAKNGDATYRLRIFVTGLDCHGAQFGFAFDQAETADDVALEVTGIPLIVDSLSYPYLAGAEIDYADKGEGAHFIVRSPRAKSSCGGCGGSATCHG